VGARPGPVPGRADAAGRVRPRVAGNTPERQAADAGIECIGCGVCYGSCDVVQWRPDYLGPAALNRAWTLVNDVRDTARTERLRAVAGDAGCHSLPHAGLVHLRCPKHRADAGIAGLKRTVARAAVKGEL
jgi:fumarate reductase iron-sulfur subunit